MVIAMEKQTGDLDGKDIVHVLMVSPEAMAIIAEAIRALTVEKLKFQRLKDVVTEALKLPDLAAGDAPRILERHLPLDGRVRIYLRLNKRLNAELDELKAELCGHLGDPCGVRETVIFCALAIGRR